MRIYMPRGLNIDESYAASRRAVRECFGEWDISVFWGEPETYSFDKSIRKGPQPEGCVIASMRLNFRKRLPVGELYFYVIRDSRYDKERQIFCDAHCLPRMHDWLSKRKENPPSGGVDEILLIWNGDGFAIQELHYN